MLTFLLEEPAILGAKVILSLWFFELHDLQRHFKKYYVHEKYIFL